MHVTKTNKHSNVINVPNKQSNCPLNAFNHDRKTKAIPSFDHNNWRMLFDYLSDQTRDTKTLLGEVHIRSIMGACALADRTFEAESHPIETKMGKLSVRLTETRSSSAL